ncbi:hypothetical protein EOE67_09870 [Rheinheimera riviphila]|uniref:Lipoprotein n=1 Tax=Rheinheimera riviphila TaxID=1834037 RepID=A0A437QSJ0_9GAMM|nr:hypothetical protein [Rheinheimera riviphila]RVU37488.1 hypothetical protein EOE67_09870 [Rheinheimera riviphila]
MKESGLLKRCFSIVAMLLFVVGIGGCEGKKEPAAAIADWQIALGDIQLTISPGQIPVETLLRLQLRSEQPLQLVSAEMTGVSMYMGKIPLRFTFDAATGLWSSDFMLGACSDPKMIWQLQLQLTDSSGTVRQLSTQLQSSWR